MNAIKTLPFLALLSSVVPAAAFQSLESNYRLTGQGVLSAFEAQRAVLQTSSAVMLNGRREIAYGVVVSPEGHVLTKASEIAGVSNLSLRVGQQAYADAKVVAVDDEWDVALVKVEASGLTPVDFAPTSNIPQGTWVVANGATSLKARRVLVGIISAKIRAIPAGGGNPAIDFKENSLQVEDVTKDSGAGAAGMKKGDVITAIEGQKVETFDQFAEAIKKHKPGSVVKFTYLRGDEEKTADVKLEPGPPSRNDMMSGAFSDRRSGFPRVMQHDIIGDKSIVGGPLLDLEGRCVGMNIARANRAESFAIPVEDLRALAERLVKGK